ncbi:hypothetical protein [Haladaptatus halobius]|uniref:hypothetical protein n=1 Tax=Haladaptatus halobius TaxID=2884875 RepID=UPI001D0B12C3|nr:hypothetical protein [Haladaptatus halobius]
MLNIGLTFLFAGVLAGIGRADIAIFAVIIGTIVIGVRGYLVPGTPTLTGKLPESVISTFWKTASPSAHSATEALIASEVLNDDLILAKASADRICERAEVLVANPKMLDTVVLDVFPDAVETTVRRSLSGGENWFVSNVEQMTTRQWEARPIAAIDAASAEYLSTILSDWEVRSDHDRMMLLALVRYGLPRCPSCKTPYTELDAQTVTCCGGRSLVGSRRCESCEYALVDSNDLPLDAREDEE